MKKIKKSKPTFETARFHNLTGPESLFRRVKFKFKDVTILRPHGDHYNKRLIERDAPVKSVTKFDINNWRLVNVEVRTDTGKFVNTAWEFEAENKIWRVVIGFESTILTIIQIKGFSNYTGSNIVKNGELYDFVEQVNNELMEAEGKGKL